MSALATEKHSSPYNTVGIHLVLTSWIVTSSDANLPILPKMALVDFCRSRSAHRLYHWQRWQEAIYWNCCLQYNTSVISKPVYRASLFPLQPPCLCSGAFAARRDDPYGSLMLRRALPGECVTNDYDNASEAIEVQTYRDFGSGSQRRDPVDPGRRPHLVKHDWSMMMHCARSCTVHLQVISRLQLRVRDCNTSLLRHWKTRSSSGDEIANANCLRRHPTRTTKVQSTIDLRKKLWHRHRPHSV